MRNTLGVPATMLELIANFIKAEGIAVDLISGDACAMQVMEGNERRRCGLRGMYIDGCIACETARSMTAKPGIRRRQMGKLLDLPDIRVRSCGPGCFN